MNAVYFMGWSFFRAVFKGYFRWRVFNAERVPSEGPVLLAANHASFLAPPLVGSGLHREMHYLARETLFQNPFFGKILRKVNAVPVDREGGGAAGLRAVLDVLQSREAIVLFPEGTRSKSGQIQRARSGIGLVVLKTMAPVVPVRIFGTYEAFGPHFRFPRPYRVIVKYGQPLDFTAEREEAIHCPKPRLRDLYQEVSDRIMATIARLQPCREFEVFP